MIDEQVFFRGAALRISGNLDLSVALVDFLNYCNQFMPAERCSLTTISPHLLKEYNAMEVVVDVDLHGVKNRNVMVPIPWQLRELLGLFERKGLLTLDLDGIGLQQPITEELEISELLKGEKIKPELKEALNSLSGKRKFIEYIESPKHHLSVSSTVETLNLPNLPIVSGLLSIGKTVVGGFMITNYTGERFTDEHLNLLFQVRQMISIAFINHMRFRHMRRMKDALADENLFLHEELEDRREAVIIGADYGLKQTMDMVRHVARQDSPVMLLGETGVGKEVIANAIHYTSPRRNGPFIKVNCGAIPDNLIDSELFGHEKGAFTGALMQKKGRFERADKGTIFLDEVGELPLEVQVRLLRVLQEKEIERVGGTESIPTDIRIIAATNRDLKRMVEKGDFREDLYFRLNVFPIEIPPLRQRRVDIPPLTHHILSEKAREMNLDYTPILGPGAIEQLMNYPWPGNVRELENTIERAIILYRNSPLYFNELLYPASAEPKSEEQSTPSTAMKYEDLVRGHIEKVLALTEGKVHGKNGAAEILGLNPSTLRKRMRKLGIKFGRSYIQSKP